LKRNERELLESKLRVMGLKPHGKQHKLPENNSGEESIGAYQKKTK
jgi:hypothetical protein